MLCAQRSPMKVLRARWQGHLQPDTAVATATHPRATAMLPVVAVAPELQLHILEQPQTQQRVGSVLGRALPAAAIGTRIRQALFPRKRTWLQRLRSERNARPVERWRIVCLRGGVPASDAQRKHRQSRRRSAPRPHRHANRRTRDDGRHGVGFQGFRPQGHMQHHWQDRATTQGRGHGRGASLHRYVTARMVPRRL